MGNCLKRAGGNQQDNTTLLSSNPEPAVSTSGSSQDGLGPPIPYNVITHRRAARSSCFSCFHISVESRVVSPRTVTLSRTHTHKHTHTVRSAERNLRLDASLILSLSPLSDRFPRTTRVPFVSNAKRKRNARARGKTWLS